MKTQTLFSFCGILQVPGGPSVSIIENAAVQYGILGILAFVLSFFAWNQFKRLTQKNDKLEEKVDILQEEMMTMIMEEKERLATLVQENTKALNDLRNTIVQYLLMNSSNSEN
jgi:hypothetical protein